MNLPYIPYQKMLARAIPNEDFTKNHRLYEIPLNFITPKKQQSVSPNDNATYFRPPIHKEHMFQNQEPAARSPGYCTLTKFVFFLPAAIFCERTAHIA